MHETILATAFALAAVCAPACVSAQGPAPFVGGDAAVVLLEDAALDVDDPLTYDGKRYERFTIELEAGATYRIDMVSEHFDTYLAVHSPSGRVRTNDDGPDTGTDAQLTLAVEEAGAYTIYATSFAAGVEGGFLLRVERIAAE